MHRCYLVLLVAAQTFLTYCHCQSASSRHESIRSQQEVEATPEAARIARRSPALEEARRRIRERKKDDVHRQVAIWESFEAKNEQLEHDRQRPNAKFNKLLSKYSSISRNYPENQFTEAKWKFLKLLNKLDKQHRKISQIHRRQKVVWHRINKIRMSGGLRPLHYGQSPSGSTTSSEHSPSGSPTSSEHSTLQGSTLTPAHPNSLMNWRSRTAFL